MIELVPNVSEGRRTEVVAALASQLADLSGVHLLDVSSDRSHHRSVYTLVGEPARLEHAAQVVVAQALSAIDLRCHTGRHPRIGAVDVLPFVPLPGSTMSDCVRTARRVGAAIAARFELPVFLYEEAALVPGRHRLEDIRRGQFEGLDAKFRVAGWAPDFGPPHPHPTAGAIAVGARGLLVAFNVNLASDRIDVARRVASAVRERSGGLPGVKALGLTLDDRGIVQVSMNLTDVERTTLGQAFERVRDEAARDSVDVLESEIVGLVPRSALVGTEVDALRLSNRRRDWVLEDRLASLST